jgi:hypothetical protein
MTGGRIPGDLPGRLKTVDLGHDDVHQDQIRQFGLGDFDALLAVRSGQNFVPMLFKNSTETQRLSGRVVDNEYAGHAATPGMILHIFFARQRLARAAENNQGFLVPFKSSQPYQHAPGSS